MAVAITGVGYDEPSSAGDEASSADGVALSGPSAGSNRVYVIGIVAEHGSAANEITALTFGGQTMTRLGYDSVSTGFTQDVSLWYALESTVALMSGTALVPTYASALSDSNYAAAVIEGTATGANQAAPKFAIRGTDVTPDEGGAQASIREYADGAIFGFASHELGTTAATFLNLTEVTDAAGLGNLHRVHYGHELTTVNQDVTVSCYADTAGGDQRRCILGLISFEPAGGGSDPAGAYIHEDRAIEVLNSASATSGDNSVDITVPAGVTDALLAFHFENDSTQQTITGPGGTGRPDVEGVEVGVGVLIQQSSDQFDESTHVFPVTSPATGANVTIAWNNSQGGQDIAVQFIPIMNSDGFGNSGSDSDGSASDLALSITSTAANSLLVAAGSVQRFSNTLGAGTDTVLDGQGSVGSGTLGLSFAAFSRPMPSSGVSYTANVLHSVSDPAQIAGFEVLAAAAASGRDVDATLESLTLTANAAAVNRARGVSAALESLSLTVNQATITQELAVSANVENLTFTANAADIAASREVSAAIEPISLTALAADVDAGRAVGADQELLSLTVSAAEVNRTRGVSGALESLSLTVFGATVQAGADRIVSAAVESLALTTPQAAVNRQRGVNTSLEALSLTTGAAEIQRGATVPAAREILSLATSVASVITTRGVQAALEVLRLQGFRATIDGPTGVVVTPQGGTGGVVVFPRQEEATQNDDLLAAFMVAIAIANEDL